MDKRDVLRRRIRTCRTIMFLHIAVVIVSIVAVWNPPDMHRRLFNRLWYASLFIQAGFAFIQGRRISEAKEELDELNDSVDL